MTGTDIFLSYARQDRGTARMFAECFMEEGFSVWWDASLHSGETFDEVIEQRLRDAKAVVVLWSPRSVASRWVRAEATLADRRNKLAPAIIEACDRPIIFELTHAAELQDWEGDTADARWRTFVHDLKRLVDVQARDVEPAAAPAANGAAPQPSRQPLRPGSNEVIAATPRELPMRQPAPVAPPPPPMAEADASGEVHCLEVEEGEVSEDAILVNGHRLKIGRAAPADIVLPHKSISREHCIIGLANDELLVTDLNSTNGTFVDDVRISRATILPVGSVLRLGQVSLRHAIHASAAECEARHERVAVTS
ncbi:MAG TPA: TIR domain-containing protein [Sphingomicrobium sp.]